MIDGCDLGVDEDQVGHGRILIGGKQGGRGGVGQPGERLAARGHYVMWSAAVTVLGAAPVECRATGTACLPSRMPNNPTSAMTGGAGDLTSRRL